MVTRVANGPRFGLARLRRPRASTVAWALPVIVYYFVREAGDGAVERAVAIALAVGLLTVVRRHPAGALLCLLALIPFQIVIFSYLYRLGVPEAVVRPLSSWRDLIILGLAVAAYFDFTRGRRRLDTLDKLALTFIALVTAYLLLPDLFVRGATADFAGAPKDWETRLLAYRINIGFVLLFLAARHSNALKAARDRALPVILISGTVVAAVAIFEFSFSDAWNTFAVETLQTNVYRFEVLDTVPRNWTDVRSYTEIGDNQVVRPGSTLFDPLHSAFALLVPLACGLELITRNRARWSFLATSTVAVALLMTNVRSAVVGAVIIASIAARQKAGRTTANRVRVGTLLVLALVLLAPVAASSGFSDRASQATDTSDDSTNAHIEGFWNGIRALGDDPLGRGLGTQPGIGDRFRVETKVTSENGYLQVGNELGIVTMGVFVTLVIVLLRRLRVAAAVAWTLPIASAARAAAWGLAVGALFLHVWNYYAATYSMWAAAGLAIGAASREPVGAGHRST